MKCFTKCSQDGIACKEKKCRLWIDYSEDLNCTVIVTQKNHKLVFREIGKRLKLTPSRVKQIETAALKKLNTRMGRLLNIL